MDRPSDAAKMECDKAPYRGIETAKIDSKRKEEMFKALSDPPPLTEVGGACGWPYGVCWSGICRIP